MLFRPGWDFPGWDFFCIAKPGWDFGILKTAHAQNFARLRRVLPLPTKPGWDFLGGIFCAPPKLGGILGFPTQVWVGFYTKVVHDAKEGNLAEVAILAVPLGFSSNFQKSPKICVL